MMHLSTRAVFVTVLSIAAASTLVNALYSQTLVEGAAFYEEPRIREHLTNNTSGRDLPFRSDHGQGVRARISVKEELLEGLLASFSLSISRINSELFGNRTPGSPPIRMVYDLTDGSASIGLGYMYEYHEDFYIGLFGTTGARYMLTGRLTVEKEDGGLIYNPIKLDQSPVRANAGLSLLLTYSTDTRLRVGIESSYDVDLAPFSSPLGSQSVRAERSLETWSIGALISLEI